MQQCCVNNKLQTLKNIDVVQCFFCTGTDSESMVELQLKNKKRFKTDDVTFLRKNEVKT